MDDFTRGDYKKAFCENGIGKVFFKGDKRPITACGKIGMWAYAASRVLDYLLTRLTFLLTPGPECSYGIYKKHRNKNN